MCVCVCVCVCVQQYFGKLTIINVTNTKFNFLPVHESYTHSLSKDTKHFTIDGQVCFYGWPFLMLSNTRVNFMACEALKGH